MNSDRKAIIITGSSSGIGAEVAKLAARHGYNVLVNYNSNAAGGEAVAAECAALGVQAVAVQANVAEDGDCRKLAAAAVDAKVGVMALPSALTMSATGMPLVRA